MPRNFRSILDDLRALGEVKVDENLTLLCLVGGNLRYTPGVAAEVFGSIRDINVLMVSHGASNINMSFLVDQKDADAAVQKLHAYFFREVSIRGLRTAELTLPELPCQSVKVMRDFPRRWSSLTPLTNRSAHVRPQGEQFRANDHRHGSGQSLQALYKQLCSDDWTVAILNIPLLVL